LLLGVILLTELAERVAVTETDIEALKSWQKTQNGCLLRLEDKIDTLYKMVIGLLGGAATSLVLLSLNLVLKT
jgi:hypothetical protein